MIYGQILDNKINYQFHMWKNLAIKFFKNNVVNFLKILQVQVHNEDEIAMFQIQFVNLERKEWFYLFNLWRWPLTMSITM